MFCKNCGKEISENARFCPHCGSGIQSEPVIPAQSAPYEAPVETMPYEAPVEPTPYEVPIDAAPYAAPVEVAPGFMPTEGFATPPMKPKKSGKKVGLIVGIVAAALAIIAAIVFVVMWILGSGDEEKNNNSYVSEVEQYLNFFANKEDSVDKLLSDTYLFGGFGYLYSGNDATEINEMYARAMFEDEKEDADMGYTYGSFDYNNWKDYTKETLIDYFYEEMEYEYGDDWEMTYEIIYTEEVSESEIEELQEIWEEGVLDFYDDLYDEIGDDLDKADRKKFRNFIGSIEDLEVTEGYCVEVDIEVTDEYGDTEDNSVEFVVAKVGKEWVILDGISPYSLF